MSYFGGQEVPPQPNAEDAPFWAHCAARRLAFQCCAACGRVTHPPLGVCPACQSLDRQWVDAPEEARAFSFTWIHTAAHDSLMQSLPYNVAVVEFPALAGVRLITNIVNVRPGELAIGDRVRLVWEAVGETLLPRFQKVLGPGVE